MEQEILNENIRKPCLPLSTEDSIKRYNHIALRINFPDSAGKFHQLLDLRDVCLNINANAKFYVNKFCMAGGIAV